MSNTLFFLIFRRPFHLYTAGKLTDEMALTIIDTVSAQHGASVESTKLKHNSPEPLIDETEMTNFCDVCLDPACVFLGFGVFVVLIVAVTKIFRRANVNGRTNG